ncbi:MAG: nucleotide exchange factor GrpE [Clostridia bacterium]|nr:nucleotide exchange factor GrpE [Clostridia bacterium]
MKKKGKKMNMNQEAQNVQTEQEALDEEMKEAAEVSQEETFEEEVMPTQEEWAEALRKTVEERDSYKDSYLRAQAEFQNFKRRNASVRTEAYDEGVRETLFAVLPIIDNLELAIKHAEQQGENGAMVDGVKKTLKLLTDELGKKGLEEVPALGEKFDPELHNAIMREAGGEEDVICEVFQKGYKVKDKMIRYAMVKVSSGEE